jgi:hypothetical protein
MAAQAREDLTARSVGLGRTLPVLVGWFFVTVWLGVRGALGGEGGPPIGVGLAIGLPLLVFALDRRLGGPLLGGLGQLDLTTLIALQTFRVGGLFFLIAWWGGTLPGAFALPAGIGDIAIGIAAPFVAAAVAARRPGARTLALVWNVAGLLDLALAVTEGVTHTRSSFGVFAGAIPSDALGRYPFSLIPTFFVPLAIMLHLSALRLLRRGEAGAAVLSTGHALRP